MSIPLNSTISTQITNKDIDRRHTFKINSTDFTDYLFNWSVSHDRKFGSASATFTLNNTDSNFGSGGDNEIKVGDTVEFIETFGGDTTQFKRFYGLVEQRSISKDANQRSISLSCLDYISVLQKWDVDAEYEGTKVEITEETLTPNYLSAPNNMFAQLFDFANNAIADNPRPVLMIRNKLFNTDDTQSDGFDILFGGGQVRLGAPLNALSNHDLIARSYNFYTIGVFAEDVLESLLKTVDGYGNFLFYESSAVNVVTNHLQTTFQDEDGAGYLDYLTPNLTSSSITIRHTTTAAIAAGDTSITISSIDGLPASGTATINGDTFTWSSIVASTKTLIGIPATGSNALKSHPSVSYLKYTNSYAAGRVWYLKYSNLVTDLVAGNFTIPGANLSYFDKRYGRIILDIAISTTAIVRCNYNYTLKTIQATGVELNRITFRSRELGNRFEAIQKLKKYLAPNFVIRTIGDNKIWASYLSQRTTADYTLNLIESLNYQEDDDLYTRVKMYGKNKNPTNIMFNDNVDFVTTAQTYRGVAGQIELAFDKTEDGWHIYKSLISDAGKIVLDNIKPIVYIDGVPIDNTLRQMVALPVIVRSTTRTETTTTSSKGGNDIDVRTYYYYQIHFAHQNIEPTQIINLYNPNGVQIMTISPNDNNMDYGRGIYSVPGTSANSTVEAIATATYWVMYSTRNLQIDYDNVRFKISSSILTEPVQSKITATFEYFTVFTSHRGVGAIMDGRWDTQVQTEFFTQPPAGYRYAIIDLGSVQEVQAVDIVAGFYRPDEIRKFDIDMRLSLQSSTDNITYTSVSDSARAFNLQGGQSISFEEEDLGIGFQARYILVLIENLRKIDFGNGIYVAAITEVAAYTNIIINSEATLISTTETTATVTSASTTIPVESTEGFTEPSSGGDTDTAYIDEISFTYTGLTSTSFTGCVISSGVNELSGTRVHQSIAGDTTVYDDNHLLQQLGDRVFKDIRISDEILYTQTQLDDLAKAFLREFIKEHNKVSTTIIYSPYLKVGQTVALTDTYNNQTAVNFFIESIQENSGNYQLILAKYPA